MQDGLLTACLHLMFIQFNFMDSPSRNLHGLWMDHGWMDGWGFMAQQHSVGLHVPTTVKLENKKSKIKATIDLQI